MANKVKYLETAPKATYQARIKNFKDVSYDQGIQVLAEYAELQGHMGRKLFADIISGKSASDLTKVYPRKYNTSVRVYESVKKIIEGLISSQKALQKDHSNNLETRIKKLDKEINKLNLDKAFRIHNNKRRLNILQTNHTKLDQDIELNKVRIAFGSKKLWRKQFSLELNNYKDHQEWLADWQFNRNNKIFIMGSRNELAGNQFCQAKLNENGNLDLRIRLPYCLESEYGKYLTISDINFNYGHDYILAALQNCEDYKSHLKEHGAKSVKETNLGQALTYRIKLSKDKKGELIATVFVTTNTLNVPIITDKGLGTIGVDINIDHLAVTEVNSNGNYLNTFSVPLNLYGKSTNQATDIINKAIVEIVNYAKSVKKPIVLEKLDFQNKKNQLECESKKYKRMLSSFAYSKIIASFKARGYKEGVYVHQVNPAYSSIIGILKFKERYGLSDHQAAAMVLARRILRCSERIPGELIYLTNQGDRVALNVPVRNHARHVWSFWSSISKQLRSERVAQHRRDKDKVKAKSYPVRTPKSVRGLGDSTQSVLLGEIPGDSDLQGMRSRLDSS